MIARVQPLTRTRAVRGPFDYAVPEAMAAEVAVGALLRVPFSGRKVPGVVVELAAGSELAPERLATPERVLNAGLTPELVALARWMAREYCSTTARALALMLPPGAADGRGAKRALVATLTADGAAVLGDPGGAGHLNHPSRGFDAQRAGGRALTDAQRALLQQLAARGGTATAAELGTEALRRLERRGLVQIAPRIVPRRPANLVVGRADALAPPLTPDQRAAADALLAVLHAPAARRREEFLLQGVTGSGKTEVYLAAVQAALDLGRTAIVLVPEIALTPQALGRFQARFGDVVAVLHSALSAGERHDEWMRLRCGEARVCVGPRSAVLAPLEDIGLIVVDEEHESSYKHEGDPRYDARGVARRRAREHDALLVFGSATPRPETVTEMRRLSLPHRVDGRAMPPVEVLDMRGSHQPLHPETRMALADLRHGGGKAILLLNRRGWSNFLSCRSCGHVWLCPNCELALVLHAARSSGALRGHVACHHCGHREPVPGRCPECASVSVARHGAGTERIEHELREALGSAGFPVFRLDAGATGLEVRARTLQAFERAPAGLLVGTQMVAKGHDFPDVSLGVVLDADQTLRFPDFRAEERTFSLVTQLAGRIGRPGGDGRPGAGASRVLVQTLAPDARPLRFAAEHDADGFIADELIRRRALAYPPYASLIRVVCAAESEAPAREAAEAIHARLVHGEALLLGPAPLFRLRGRHRTQIVVKARERRPAIDAVGAAVDAVGPAAARAGVSVSVDVDPQ
ncbi:MAG TPA: primosomal protein N' [Solirubrobacteraceae bacterium]|nr:primosomal protein N' [Solirubrobacteraceae bacterium]